MALFFMVAGILVSGVSQAIRVAEVGSTEATNSRDQGMRLAWFREAVGLTVLPPPTTSANPPPPLIGDARSVESLSIAVPNARSRAPSRYRFEIQFDATSGESRLQLRDPARDSPVADGDATAVLATWRGSEGRFFFLDEDNVWQERWPVSPAAVVGRPRTALRASELPKAVELRYGSPAQSVVVAIQDRSMPPPSLAEMMK